MLDSETPTGIEYIAHQGDVLKTICRVTASSAFTSGKLGGDVGELDAIFTRSSTIVAVAEIKCRNLKLEELEKFGSYMISSSKIDAGVLSSRHFNCLFLVVAKLIQSNLIVWWTVSSGGVFKCPFESSARKTAESCNGGEKTDIVCLLPLTHMAKCRV